MQLIDLHTHSTASDGSDSPAELVRLAAKAGLAALALTDHDTLAGLPEARAAAAEAGLEFIPGCELSARGTGGEVHILGLWIPEDHPNLATFERTLAELRGHRERRNRIIVDRLQGLGCALDYDEVLAEAGGDSVGRPHIARVLLRKGYAQSPREVFNRWLGSKCPAYEPKKALSPEEAVRLAASVGGTPILAHPGLIGASEAELERLTGELKGYGLMALEAYHSEHSDANTRFCVGLADRLGLAVSGGSDYHGRLKPAIAPGRGRGGLRVSARVLEGLKEQRLKRGLPI